MAKKQRLQAIINKSKISNLDLLKTKGKRILSKVESYKDEVLDQKYTAEQEREDLAAQFAETPSSGYNSLVTRGIELTAKIAKADATYQAAEDFRIWLTSEIEVDEVTNSKK